MKIFISHITEEKAMAERLKYWIESLFLGNFEVFVSSDGESIRLGRKWLEEINKSLSDCAIMIVLCSPTSVSRPWINFEAGCGWIKDIPIVPFCHSGLKLTELPPPLGFLQGVSITDDSFCGKLLKHLADDLGVKKAPIAHPDMLRELREAEPSMICEENLPNMILMGQGEPVTTGGIIGNRDDIRNLLVVWISKQAGYEILVKHEQVDKEFGFVEGSTKAMIAKAAFDKDYDVQQQGELTTLLRRRPIDPIVRRSRWAI